MTFLGMGPLEILLILLVAFVVMGPDRMFDAARLLGKATKEARRFAEEMPSLSLDDEPVAVPERPKASQGEGPDPGVPEAEAETAETPVAFQPTKSGEPPIEPEGQAQEKT